MSGYQITESAVQLLTAARDTTGIGIMDDEAMLPLGVMLKSLNDDAGMHEAGAKAMRNRLLRILCNRLRMFRDFAAHPEIEAQKINAPIMFCGLGRSGSTKTHKLVAASGDFNFLTYWEVFNPSLLTGDRSESPQPRIDEAIAYVNWFNQVSPDTRKGHAFEPLEAEEDSYVLEHSLVSPTSTGWAPIPGYLAWVVRQDMSTQFRYLKRVLQYLQWQGLASPNKRWILKCPMYAGMEREMLAVFPDASLIMTHRDPVNIVASSIRLMECFHTPFTHAPVFLPSMTGLSLAMDAHLHNRQTIPAFRVLDLSFKELTGPVEPALRKIYDFTGAELTVAARRRMLDWDAGNPQHKYGKFHYNLADYGLHEAEILHAFAAYTEFLQETFGDRA